MEFSTNGGNRCQPHRHPCRPFAILPPAMKQALRVCMYVVLLPTLASSRALFTPGPLPQPLADTRRSGRIFYTAFTPSGGLNEGRGDARKRPPSSVSSATAVQSWDEWFTGTPRRVDRLGWVREIAGVHGRNAPRIGGKSQVPCGSTAEDQFAQTYWKDPRIHSFGNVGFFGAFHAGVAPLFTYAINRFAYAGRDVRATVCEEVELLFGTTGTASPCRIADLGCGTGTMARALMAAWPSADVVALDTSEEMLAVARLLTKPRGEPPTADTDADADARGRLRYVLGNAERTRLPAASCDLVTISFLMHEAPRAGRRAILAEALRLCAPGGAVVVVDICRSYEPSPTFLVGEPYYFGYRDNFGAELRSAGFASVHLEEVVPGAAEMWICQPE